MPFSALPACCAMDDELCCVCHDAPRNTVLLACGHVCTCSQCALALVVPQLERRPPPSCPLCRAPLLGGMTAILATTQSDATPAVMALQDRLEAVSLYAADKSGDLNSRAVFTTYLLAAFAVSSRAHAAMAAHAPAVEAAAAAAADGPLSLLRAALTLRRALELRDAVPCAALLALREPPDDCEVASDDGEDTLLLMHVLHVSFWASVVHLETTAQLELLLKLLRLARGHPFATLFAWIAIRDALPSLRNDLLSFLLPASSDSDDAAARKLFAALAAAAAAPVEWPVGELAVEVLCETASLVQAAAADGATDRVARALRAGAAECIAATLRSALEWSNGVSAEKVDAAAMRCQVALRAASILCVTMRELSAADADATARDFAAADVLSVSVAVAVRAEQLRPETDAFVSLAEIASVLLSRVPALRRGRTALTVCHAVLGQTWYQPAGPDDDADEAAAADGASPNNEPSGEAEAPTDAAQLGDDGGASPVEPSLASETEFLRTVGARCALAAMLAVWYEGGVDVSAEDDAAALSECYEATICACVQIINTCSIVFLKQARLRRGSAMHADWAAHVTVAAAAAARILDALASALRVGSPQLRAVFEGSADGIACLGAFDVALNGAVINAGRGSAPVFDNSSAADSASTDLRRVAVFMRDDARVASRRFAWPLRRPAWLFASGGAWSMCELLFQGGAPYADEGGELGDPEPLWRRFTRRATYRHLAYVVALNCFAVFFFLLFACAAAVPSLGLHVAWRRVPRKCRPWLGAALGAAVPMLWRRLNLRRGLAALAARAFAGTGECRA